eukprot:5515611-Lingulodinium_polyedra.AAC.1
MAPHARRAAGSREKRSYWNAACAPSPTARPGGRPSPTPCRAGMAAQEPSWGPETAQGDEEMSSEEEAAASPETTEE